MISSTSEGARRLAVKLRHMLSLAALAAIASPASAAIMGFDGGTGWTSNGGATFSGNSVTLTQNVNNQARSVYFNTKQDVTSFYATFSYDYDQTASTNNPADGFTFVIQNAGINALGGSGGNKGYATSVTSSIAITTDFNSTDDTAVVTGGSLTTPILGSANSTIGNLDLVDYAISYDGTTLSYTITNPATTQSLTRSVAVDIPATVGGSTAWIGFTGGTGGRNGEQIISNVTFVPEPGSMLAGTGMIGLLALRRRRNVVPA